MSTALGLFCPAKLNLWLRIVGRRPDGYHLLDTLFHAIDLGDDLVAVRTAGGLALTVSAAVAPDAVPPGEDNLVLRAARAYLAVAGAGTGFAFHLHKRIPSGGGLGGGSSDAAAALRLCNALCGEPLDGISLHELARSLGADVPFFLRGGSAIGRGIGDELIAARVAPLHVTLLVPPFGCATADVYRNFAAHWHGGFDAATIRPVRDGHHHEFVAGDAIVNDLSAAAERVQPELALLRQRAAELGVGGLAMTGSGSTLFAVAADAAEAASQRQRLAPLQQSGVRLLAARSATGACEAFATRWPGGGGT